MMKALRRTKIIATLGPATDTPTTMKDIIAAGVNVVRLNFSHGTPEQQQVRLNLAREAAQAQNRVIGVLADLQGPKIRIARFAADRVELATHATFTLDANFDPLAGNTQCVGIDYKALPSDVGHGDQLLLDDGRIVLRVKSVQDTKIHCLVETGGILSNHKGINRAGGGLSAPALTAKDKEDIKAIGTMDVDYVAISFVRSAADIHEAKRLLQEAGSQACVIAKIERHEALDNLDAIINASDGVMVARGDLGVEIGDAQLPAVQKHIIHRARVLDKPVITATQMMESMIENAMPTRAEVSDVANAVLDYTDAVMLSAESAVGNYPVEVVTAMSRICLGAEEHPSGHHSGHRVECQFKRVDESIAMATMYTANHLNIKAIIALTESGATPLWMSRIRSAIPIYAFSRSQQTRQRTTLFRGIYPFTFDPTAADNDNVDRLAVTELVQAGFVERGDLVIITRGEFIGVTGHTNCMKIIAA